MMASGHFAVFRGRALKASVFLAFIGILASVSLAYPYRAWAAVHVGDDDSRLMASSLATEDDEAAKTFSFESGAIVVENVTEGSVSYDADSRILTLKNARFDCVCLRGAPDFTVNLVGESAAQYCEKGYPANVCFIYDYALQSSTLAKSNVTIIGSGSVNGVLYLAGNLTMSGGLLTTPYFIPDDEYLLRCGNLTITSGKIECESDNRALVLCSGDITVSGGSFGVYGEDLGGALETTLEGIDKPTAVQCDGSFTMNGGSFRVMEKVKCGGSFVINQGTFKGFVYSHDDARIAGGTVNGGVSCWFKDSKDGITYLSDVVMSGGTVKRTTSYGPVTARNLLMQGGTIDGCATCSGSLTMTGGVITCTGSGEAVSCEGDLVMRGGTIKASKSYHVIRIGKSSTVHGRSPSVLKMHGGTIIGTAQKENGIVLDNANLTMTGGKIKITGSRYSPIYSELGILRGRGIGGVVKLKGGTVELRPKSPNHFEAIDVLQMANKPECLKSIAGALPKGASFMSGGNVYRLDIGLFGAEASLIKYGAKSTKPTFGEVKFGGFSYEVRGVGARAFATSAGSKVKTATFKKGIADIRSNAFTGAKRMTRLVVCEPAADRYGSLKSKFWPFGSAMSKKAFAKCGKGGGRDFTVAIGKVGSKKLNVSDVRGLLKTKGLPNSAQIKLLR